MKNYACFDAVKLLKFNPIAVVTQGTIGIRNLICSSKYIATAAALSTDVAALQLSECFDLFGSVRFLLIYVHEIRRVSIFSYGEN